MNEKTKQAPAPPREGQAPGLGEKCTCPMCGQPAEESILRGLTAPWWFYQINNLARRERPDADLESAIDIEFQVVRR